MSLSAPFIRRPVATSLLGVATLLAGLLGYIGLPVSALPQVEFPTIQVTTQMPGADPDTMLALVTAPLERQLGQIAAMEAMTSQSAFGQSEITLRFALDRDIDGAAQDVQSAINAAASTLPRNLPYPPVYAKVNPADAPIATLALTSATASLRQLSDMADTLVAQKLSQVSGVGHVGVQGGLKPAIRIQADLARLSNYGLGLADIRAAIAAANVAGPKGSLDGARQSFTIAANDQLTAVESYRQLVVASRAGAPVLLKDVAEIVEGLENARSGGWRDGAPAIIIDVRRQPGANVVETVRLLQAEMTKLRRALPADVALALVNDRTGSIRAAIRDVQFTLVLSVGLVVLVVFLFLRSLSATIIAGVALPLSLIATFGVMWFAGFSLDNLSLMALTIGSGFVIDDAIVMIENIVRHIEKGAKPDRRGAEGRARDRLHHRVAHLLAARGVHPAAVHERPRRAHVSRIRADAVDRGRRLGHRVADADADDERAAVAQTEGARRGRPRPRARPHRRRLWPQPRMGARPSRRHAIADAGDAGRDRMALCSLAQGFPSQTGHRADRGAHAR
jgi:multidrug efflux pump